MKLSLLFGVVIILFSHVRASDYIEYIPNNAYSVRLYPMVVYNFFIFC